MNKIKVLIADDCEVARHGLRSILRPHCDIEVVGEAADGAESVDLAQRLLPQVVLMDVDMPGADGLAATRHLKRQFPNIKVLCLTVHSKDIEPALQAGADAYLMKDSARRQLLEALRRLGN